MTVDAVAAFLRQVGARSLEEYLGVGPDRIEEAFNQRLMWAATHAADPDHKAEVDAFMSHFVALREAVRDIAARVDLEDAEDTASTHDGFLHPRRGGGEDLSPYDTAETIVVTDMHLPEDLRAAALAELEGRAAERRRTAEEADSLETVMVHDFELPDDVRRKAVSELTGASKAAAAASSDWSEAPTLPPAPEPDPAEADGGDTLVDVDVDLPDQIREMAEAELGGAIASDEDSDTDPGADDDDSEEVDAPDDTEPVPSDLVDELRASHATDSPAPERATSPARRGALAMTLIPEDDFDGLPPGVAAVRASDAKRSMIAIPRDGEEDAEKPRFKPVAQEVISPAAVERKKPRASALTIVPSDNEGLAGNLGQVSPGLLDGDPTERGAPDRAVTPPSAASPRPDPTRAEKSPRFKREPRAGGQTIVPGDDDLAAIEEKLTRMGLRQGMTILPPGDDDDRPTDVGVDTEDPTDPTAGLPAAALPGRADTTFVYDDDRVTEEAAVRASPARDVSIRSGATGQPARPRAVAEIPIDEAKPAPPSSSSGRTVMIPLLLAVGILVLGSGALILAFALGRDRLTGQQPEPVVPEPGSGRVVVEDVRPEPEPVAEPEPVVEPEPVAEPEPVLAVPDPVPEPAPAPAAPAPVKPAPAPAAAPAPAPSPAPGTRPAIVRASPKPVPEPVPEPEPILAPKPKPAPVEAPKPAPAPSAAMLGTWQGTDGTGDFTLRVDGADGTAISGSVRRAGGTPLPVTGNFDAGSGKLTFRATDGSANYDGSIDGLVARGTWTEGSGGPSRQWLVVKQ